MSFFVLLAPGDEQALLFLRFNSYKFDVYKSKLHEVAELYKGKNISFLIGDSENSESAFEVVIYPFFLLFWQYFKMITL